jgi:hypothetical protein
VINTGGWLLLSLILSGLLLIVQRSEQKRRLVSLLIMVGVATIVTGYGIYRLSHECDLFFQQMCALETFKGRAQTIAYNTNNLSLLTALVLNLIFWVLIGRYNPPGSSDAIKVLGMDD